MRLFNCNEFNECVIESLNDGDELYAACFIYHERQAWMITNTKGRIYSIPPTKIKVHKRVLRDGYTSVIFKNDEKSFYAKCKYKSSTDPYFYGRHRIIIDDLDLYFTKEEAEKRYNDMIEEYINFYKDTIRFLEKYKSPK